MMRYGSGIDLKSCPFCGGTDLKIIDKSDSFGNKYARAVFCQDCHCTGRHAVRSGWTESDNEAAEEWNARANEDKLAFVYAVLNELLDTSGARGVYDGQRYFAAKLAAEEVLKPSSSCYACGRKALWRCDYAGEFGTCNHQMCEDHFVPEFEGHPPSASNPQSYTLCLDHRFDQKRAPR